MTTKQLLIRTLSGAAFVVMFALHLGLAVTLDAEQWQQVSASLSTYATPPGTLLGAAGLYYF